MSDKLTPYNQDIDQKCKELKRAGLIHSSWSTKGFIRFRLTVYEYPISVDHENSISALFSDFVFKQRQNLKGRK